ncbi:MAG: hypothetical protein QOE77_2978 [Blastocatellia bacterium]|jgi:hypothetical protein|nr:hypothetical protein [Blastocatellia bacterium]
MRLKALSWKQRANYLSGTMELYLTIVPVRLQRVL